MHIFKIKEKGKYIKYYFCGIRVCKKKRPFYDLAESIKNNNHFDCFSYDVETARIVKKIFKKFPKSEKIPNKKRIAFLATEFYDTGGHTEWLKNIMNAVHNLFEIKTFLTRYDRAYQLAPNKIQEIKKYSEINGINPSKNIKDDLLTLFRQIDDYSPKVLFVFMHMDDFVANGLLYLIKEYTDIRIVYCNHGSHWPVLGGLFADAFTIALPTTIYVDEKYRNIHKDIQLNLCDSFKEDIIDISEEEKRQVRKELKIPDGAYFTLTGCASYKLFLAEKSPYFEMIKHLLEKESNLIHVVITDMSDDEKQIVKNIFKKSSAKDRLKIVPLTPYYSRYFQSCDLFIDSFPIASALTHVELMKHKKVSIVKINTENALFSFHEYFPKNYPYMSDKTQDLENFVIYLLHHPAEIDKISKILYQHYLDTFEASAVRNQMAEIVKNADHLDKLFVHLDPNVHYNLEIEK